MSIFPTQDQLEQLREMPRDEAVVMLNLLRFKRHADGIDEGLSGREAYERYGRDVVPFLAKVGGRVLNAVETRQVAIGPEENEWDVALLVEYPSVGHFLQMASDPDYLEIHAHRDAALQDSRLIACRSLS